jgi:hypothetical protein
VFVTASAREASPVSRDGFGEGQDRLLLSRPGTWLRAGWLKIGITKLPE